MAMVSAGMLVGCSGSLEDSEKTDRQFRESGPGSDSIGGPLPLAIDRQILEERRFKEAPMLAERVLRGELPPVSQRLPKTPLVVVPVEEIGRYGGEIRRALSSEITDEPAITKTLNDSLTGYERPLPFSIQPNLAEKWEFRDGGRTAIFKLRVGLRWSDGHPFTVDDILFWYYDMAFDENARTLALFPSIWLVAEEPVKMEKIDDFTLKVSASKPLGRVLHAFAFDDFAYPRHVFARFHPRYNPGATYDEFRERTRQPLLVLEPGVPRMSAWVPVEWIRGQRVVYERNPYYWKVDTHGNQLPYADHLTFSVTPDPEIILLKFVNNEIDLFGRYSSVSTVSMLRTEEKKGEINVRISSSGHVMGIFLNWDSPRLNLRKAIRKRNVRIALSLAINREEISEILYQGFMEPCGYSFSRLSPYFSEEAFKRFSQFDPEAAATLLEEAGYRDDDGDGFREFEDGSRFELIFDIIGKGRTNDFAELIAEYWEEVGVKVHLNVAREEIIFVRRLNGKFDVSFLSVDASSDPMGKPNSWAIMTPRTPWWHRNASVDGPEWLHQSTRLLHEAMATIEPDRLLNLMTRFRDVHTDNIPVIGIGAPMVLWGAATRLGNVPSDGTSEDLYRGWSRPVFHEQIFVRQ